MTPSPAAVTSPAGSETPAIVGLPVPHPGFVSPLAAGGHCLRGGIVTDEATIAQIGARVRFYALPWWRRLLTARPADDRALVGHDLGRLS